MKKVEYTPDQDRPDFESASLVGLPGNNLRQVREDLGISIRQLEKLTGIPRSTLSKVERGKQELYHGWKVRIEEALGREIMVYGEGN